MYRIQCFGCFTSNSCIFLTSSANCDRIKYLKGDNAYMREQMQRLKNEVRRLKNNQQDDSVVCERYFH